MDDLTVDNLCLAIRHRLRQLADGPGCLPAGKDSTLVLCGTPADDTMKTVMDLLGGTLRIRVSEVPTGLKDELVPLSDVAGGINLWKPAMAAEGRSLND